MHGLPGNLLQRLPVTVPPLCDVGDQSLHLANIKGKILETLQAHTAANDPSRRCAEVQSLPVPFCRDDNVISSYQMSTMKMSIMSTMKICCCYRYQG